MKGGKNQFGKKEKKDFVQCTTADDCQSSEVCFEDTEKAVSYCKIPCTQNEECGAAGDNKFCNTDTGSCQRRGCFTNDDCVFALNDSNAVCETVTFVKEEKTMDKSFCVASCVENACSGKELCDSNNLCRRSKCSDTSDCAVFGDDFECVEVEEKQKEDRRNLKGKKGKKNQKSKDSADKKANKAEKAGDKKDKSGQKENKADTEAGDKKDKSGKKEDQADKKTGDKKDKSGKKEDQADTEAGDKKR